MTEPIVTVTGLNKTYGTPEAPIHACDDITLAVDAEQTVAITGPSGSGKSTLLHLIGALDSPDSGTITANGTTVTGANRKTLAAYRRTTGFVFQRFHLLPALTVLDNIIAPLLPYKPKFDMRAKARELIDLVGLSGRENALPSKLSGGQQQRVAIARALINDPPLILADEPTGNLDTATGNDIADLLFSLRDTNGTTILIATHDPALAARCDRTVHVRDGKVMEGETETGPGEAGESA